MMGMTFITGTSLKSCKIKNQNYPCFLRKSTRFSPFTSTCTKLEQQNIEKTSNNMTSYSSLKVFVMNFSNDFLLKLSLIYLHLPNIISSALTFFFSKHLFLKCLQVSPLTKVSQSSSSTYFCYPKLNNNVYTFCRLFASFVTGCVFLSNKEDKHQHKRMSYIAFLTHDLIQQLSFNLHQDIYKSWHDYSYFTFLIN